MFLPALAVDICAAAAQLRAALESKSSFCLGLDIEFGLVELAGLDTAHLADLAVFSHLIPCSVGAAQDSAVLPRELILSLAESLIDFL